MRLLNIMRSSRRRRLERLQRATGLSLLHHASCATFCGLLGSSTECRRGHKSATCSQQVAVEVGREDYFTATSREMQCYHSLHASASRWKATPTAKRATSNGQKTASTSEASRCGRPLAERYKRKHHSTRKAPSSNTSSSTSVSGRVISFHDVLFGEQSPVEDANAGRQCSGDLFQSTLHVR